MPHNAEARGGRRGLGDVVQFSGQEKPQSPTPNRQPVANPVLENGTAAPGSSLSSSSPRSPSPTSPSWLLIGTPAPNAKRVAAVCTGCGQARQFGADAFCGGYVLSCDCARLAASRASRVASFARKLAAAERQGAPVRHRGGKRP